jgi:hypothetical protein
MWWMWSYHVKGSSKLLELKAIKLQPIIPRTRLTDRQVFGGSVLKFNLAAKLGKVSFRLRAR